MNYVSVLIIVGLVIDSQSHKLLDETKCANRLKSDAEFISSAVTEAIDGLAPGLDELDLPRLEPLKIDSLSLDKDHLLYTLKQNYTNGEVHGLTQSLKISVERIDNAMGVLNMNAFNDRISFVSDYVMNGEFLQAPFRGDGRANITLLDVSTEIIIHWEKYKIDQLEFLNVTECEVKLSPRTILFDFTNFFGCRDYADSEKNAFMNINSEMFFGQNKGPLEEKLGSIFMEIANKVLNHVSKDVLFESFND